MDSNVKERLLAFIKFKGISKNRFETMCGLSKRYVSNISQSISPEVTKKISLTFPELDMGWVLTGEGDMLSTKTGTSDDSITLSGDTMRVFLSMSSTIARQEENISKLTAIIDRITGGAVPQKDAAG